MRCVVVGTVLACSAGTGAGVAQGAPDAAAPSRSVEVGGVVQGGRASTFELRARAGELARVLRVTVSELENPQNQNLVLVIAALLPAQPFEIGRLSFFPANQAGTFVLPLPAPVAEHVARDRALALRCTLESDAGVGLEAARVRLRALELGTEP